MLVYAAIDVRKIMGFLNIVRLSRITIHECDII